MDMLWKAAHENYIIDGVPPRIKPNTDQEYMEENMETEMTKHKDECENGI